MPRADKSSRYSDVVKWRAANPERNRIQNRGDQETYRGAPGSQKRKRYNEAQYLRAVRRAARRAAQKALELATARAAEVLDQKKRNGFTGQLRPNGF